MNRAEALQALDSPDPLTFEVLGDIFAAFGFAADSPTFETEVYYHPEFKCGAFTARDDGLHVVTLGQRSLVRRMIRCVEVCEQSRAR